MVSILMGSAPDAEYAKRERRNHYDGVYRTKNIVCLVR